jgi:hypothetical protein
MNAVWSFVIVLCVAAGGSLGSFQDIETRNALIGFGCLAGLWFLVQLFGCCIPNSNCMVIRQLCGDVASTDEGRSAVSNNFSLPPVMTLSASAGHFETREVAQEWESYVVDVMARRHDPENGMIQNVKVGEEVRWRVYHTHTSNWDREDRGGGRLPFITCPRGHRLDPPHTERRFVTVWNHSMVVEYTSLQENGQMPVFPRDNAVMVKSSFVADPDGATRALMEQLKANLFAEGKTHDTDVNVGEAGSVPNFISEIVVSLNDELVMSIREFYATHCGRFLWFICLLTGYQSSFECYCNLGYDAKNENHQLAVQCVKIFSVNPVFRVHYMLRDAQAAALAAEMFALPPMRMEESTLQASLV